MVSFKKQSPKKSKIPYGEYTSVVKKVAMPEGFADGEAVDIFYELAASDGTKYNFSERFFLKGYSERRDEFVAYLQENGYDPLDVDSFVGTVENVTLLKRISNGRPMLSIVKRSIIG